MALPSSKGPENDQVYKILKDWSFAIEDNDCVLQYMFVSCCPCDITDRASIKCFAFRECSETPYSNINIHDKCDHYMGYIASWAKNNCTALPPSWDKANCSRWKPVFIENSLFLLASDCLCALEARAQACRGESHTQWEGSTTKSE